MPNFGLVNQQSLDKILKVEVFIHTDGQLRAAHLILDYTPISKSFLDPKCVIKARDPWLHWISVAAPGFLLPGLVPKGTLTTKPIFEAIQKLASPPKQTIGVATSSYPTNIEEEEVVEAPDFEVEFEVFNQALSPETSTPDLGQPFSLILDEMGIQRKPKSSLMDLIESQPGKDTPGKVAQTKSPTPPPTLPLQLGPADLKRKREPKGKEVIDVGKTHPS